MTSAQTFNDDFDAFSEQQSLNPSPRATKATRPQVFTKPSHTNKENLASTKPTIPRAKEPPPKAKANRLAPNPRNSKSRPIGKPPGPKKPASLPKAQLAPSRPRHVPSVQDPAQTLENLLAENSKLVGELNRVNDHLSSLIEQQGYKNLLSRSQKQPTNLNQRNTSLRARAYDNELLNNEKILITLKSELFHVNQALERIRAPEFMPDLLAQAGEQRAANKQLKAELFHLALENKRRENLMVKGREPGGQAQLKQVSQDVDDYRRRIEEMKGLLSRLAASREELARQQQANKRREEELQAASSPNPEPSDLDGRFQEQQAAFERWLKHCELVVRSEQQRSKLTRELSWSRERSSRRPTPEKLRNQSEP